MISHQRWPTGDVRSFHLFYNTQLLPLKFKEVERIKGLYTFHILNLIKVLTIFTVPETAMACNFLIIHFTSFLSKFKDSSDVFRSMGIKPNAPITIGTISNL